MLTQIDGARKVSINFCTSLILILSASEALSDVSPPPGDVAPEFIRSLQGDFRGAEIGNLEQLMRRTAIPILGQEKIMICKVLTTPCKDRRIFESIRFTHVFFFLKVVGGQLTELTIESAHGVLHQFDLDVSRSIEFEFNDSFPAFQGCGSPSSLAVLTMRDRQGHGGRLIAYGIDVGCPEKTPLRKAYQYIPYKFRYLSLDGAIGYQELN